MGRANKSNRADSKRNVHLIVTHDNADFDAVASLLGASKLYPEAVPMTPYRINRNVRAFLTLYWDEFNFIAPGERRFRHIDHLTMVDGHTVPSLRGLGGDTDYSVIDHHTISRELPPGTQVTLTQTGACSTLFVEQIRSRGEGLSLGEATLLLLGIYEDTGHLTYGSTTVRDVQAAAWLLEQGAQLDIVNEFLNYPLSASQRGLYDVLISGIETHEVEGRTIMLTTARTDEYVEEVSTLAHKLRDLYEPDALFIVVSMADHVQIVARSTTDDIDVGRIAGQLGGGGHARAAAALVRGSSLREIRERLLDILREEVTPAVTVRQIMSYGVHTLSPSDTVKEAAEMMTRYGHEGFPVVRDGRVVGVLTRRQIDKAMHHRLGGVAIGQYMHKGDIYVTPDDSIEKLQELMTTEGIGQIPVVSGGQIIGIVTRTDLINLWSRPSRGELAESELADSLKGVLKGALKVQLSEYVSGPLMMLLKEAGEIAAGQGNNLYLVGGFVRDLLLEVETPAPDIDLVVEGDAVELAHRLARKHGGRVRGHRRFGTAKWIIKDGELDGEKVGLESLDFVTARTEFYEHPTALPQVERSSIKQDLARRDFTINTMALSLHPARFGQLLDFFGGKSDLETGLIRVLHSLSFVEDPTRILRAARFEQRLDFRIEERTLELLQGALDLLNRVSGERIYHELVLIFREAEPEKTLVRLGELGALAQVEPELVADGWLCEKYELARKEQLSPPWCLPESAAPSETVYLGLLTYRLDPWVLEDVISRLRIRAHDANVLRDVQTLKTRIRVLQSNLKPSRLYGLLELFERDALLITWLSLKEGTARDNIALYQGELRGVTPLIDGHYLRDEFGLKPGPVYRRILLSMRDARLDGLVNTLEDEHKLAESLIRAVVKDSPSR